MKLLASTITLAALATLVSGQSEAWCRCAMFVSGTGSEMMVYELPEAPIPDCTSHDLCRDRCTTEFNEMTNNMDLWSTVNGDTVGQYICSQLYGWYVFWIHNSYVHAYYEMCGGPWEYAALSSQQMLCCNMGHHEHCISKA